MNILLLGSSGLLGKELYRYLNTHFNVHHTGLKKKIFDLGKKKNIHKILLNKNYDLVINCTAITNIDFCEKYKKKTKRINEELVKNLFSIKERRKLKFYFIQFSTDQMYDGVKKGNEYNKPIIQNEYTRQKVNCEKECLKNNSLVIRINFINKNKRNLLGWLVSSVKKNKKLILFKDIKFNPLRSATIAKIIFKIIKSGNYKKTGLYNLGSSNGISKSKFCLKVFKYLKKKVNYQILSSDGFFKCKRPKNMIMNIKKFERNFNFKLPKIESEIKNEIKSN